MPTRTPGQRLGERVHLRVVRRDDDDLGQRRRPRRRSSLDHARAPPRPPPATPAGCPSCSTGDEAQPGPERRRPLRAPRRPARAAPRRTPPRCSRRRPGAAGTCARGRGRGRAGSSRRRRAGAAAPRRRCRRVRPLDHLGELLRVADEDDVPRRRPHRERVGERHLAGLVDEEVVERAVVRRARRARPCRRRASTPAHVVGVGRRSRSRSPVVARLRVAAARLLAARRRRSRARRRASTTRRAACGSPCGSSRRRRPSSRSRAGARSGARTSTSCPSRAGPG